MTKRFRKKALTKAETDFYTGLTARMKSARVENGYTQEEMGLRVGRTRSWAVLVENNRIRPSLHMIDRWLKQCGQAVRVEMGDL